MISDPIGLDLISQILNPIRFNPISLMSDLMRLDLTLMLSDPIRSDQISIISDLIISNLIS